MKTLIRLTIIVVLVFINSLAFSQWEVTHAFYGENGISSSDISFADPRYGWAAYAEYLSPSSGNVLYVQSTSDYGNSWTTKGGCTASYPDVAEIISTGPDTVFVFVNHEMGSHFNYSYDGGDLWDYTYFGENTKIYDAFLLNGEIGYLICETVSSHLLIKYTEAVNLDTLINTNTLDLLNSRIFFLNSNTGYVTAEDEFGNHVLLYTNNEGSTWNVNSTTDQFEFQNLAFDSDSTGFIICNDGHVLKTTDYGMTLTELATPTNDDMFDIQIVDDSSTYIAGDDGTIIYSRDHGLTWSIDPISVSDRITRIQMVDFDHGYVLNWDDRLYSKNNMSSIPSFTQEPFKLYPNPATDYIYIDNPDSSTINEIKIYNTLGAMIKSEREIVNQIDISILKPGLYLICLTLDNNNYVKKIYVSN